MMKIYLKNDNPLSDGYMRHVELLKESEKYDVIISKEDCTDEILSEFKNILLTERQDCASIWCRKLLKHPHVKNLLKMFHYPDVATNNAPCVGGRVFIEDSVNAVIPSPELSQADMDKVIPGFSFFHNKRFDAFFDYVRSATFKPLKERSIDVMYAGTTIFGPETPAGAWVTAKRKQCVKNIKALEEHGLNVIAADHREFTNKQYLDLLGDSKVFLSPFGWGEYCGKDFESLMSGCLLFKPSLKSKCKFIPDFDHCINYLDDFDSFSINHYNKIIQDQEYNGEEIRQYLLSSKDNEANVIKDILT